MELTYRYKFKVGEFLNALKTTGINGEPINFTITDIKFDIIGGYVNNLEKENRKLRGKLEVMEGVYEALLDSHEALEKNNYNLTMKLYAWSKDEEIQIRERRIERLEEALRVYSKKLNWGYNEHGHKCIFNADTNGPYIALKALGKDGDQ